MVRSEQLQRIFVRNQGRGRRVCIDDAVASIDRLFCIAVDGGSEGGSRRAGWPVGVCHREKNRKGFVSSCLKKKNEEDEDEDEDEEYFTCFGFREGPECCGNAGGAGGSHSGGRGSRSPRSGGAGGR